MDQEIKNSILKTGTLTLGIVCKDGIVLAADNRQSYGTSEGAVLYIAGKAKKIYEIGENIVVTTAGTASDSRRVINIIKAELRLKELKSKKRPSVKETANLLSNMLYQNIRQPSMIPSMAHFLLAGYDETGVLLYDAAADGYLQEIKDYATTGSGMREANSILDSEYDKSITIEQGIKLAIKCMKASMGREPSVGDGIDIYTIKDREIKEALSKKVELELINKKE